MYFKPTIQIRTRTTICIPTIEDRLYFRRLRLVHHQRPHIGKQSLRPMAKDALLNLDGHEGREEQTEQGESEKSQKLLLAMKRPHTLIRHPI